MGAAAGGKLETLRYLNSINPSLKHGRDDEESTALTLASEHGNKTTVQFLIEEAGLNTSLVGYEGENAFLCAAAGGKLETLRYLNSINPSLKNSRSNQKHTALTLASEAGSKATVQFLIEEAGLNPSVVGFEGRNAFLCAAAGGQLETLRYLNSINPSLKNARDDDHYTALWLAAYYGKTEVVNYLTNELKLEIY